MNKSPFSVPRREFLITSIALSLGIPGCYRNTIETPGDGEVNKPVKPLPVPSNNVIYYRRDDQEYAALKQSFNKRIEKSPKVIAACLNEKGVQEAVQYARYYKLPVAVKSGGHSFEGYSLNDDGLVIELSRLNRMSYDSNTGVLMAEPGCKLGKVYEYLHQFGRLIPAGSCGGVGVAGLTLGGGYGFFSRQYGLTCDSLLQVSMVDGLGKLHRSKGQDDLLWASKGGGNGNFGVATRFIFKTHPAPDNFTTYRYTFTRQSSESARELGRFWFQLMPSLPDSCYGSFILGHRTVRFLITDISDNPAPALKHIMRQIVAKGGKRDIYSVQPLMQAVRRYQGRPGPLYFKNVSAGYYKDFSDLDAVFVEMHKRMKQQSATLLQINVLGGAISNSRLQSTAAYPHRQMPFLGELQVYYERASQEAKAVKAVDDIQTILTRGGISKHYRNYPDIGLPNWQQAYYGDSYARLQQLKKQYDPGNLFQHPQSIELPVDTA